MIVVGIGKYSKKRLVGENIKVVVSIRSVRRAWS